MFEIITNIDNQKMDNIVRGLTILGSERLPNVSKAVQQSTELVQQRWINNANGAFKNTTGAYIRGIENGAMYPYNDDPYSGAVFNVSDNAANIENGTDAYDMKKMLYTSKKVRISEKGKRYMIIPFRHGVPGTVTMPAMPAAVHKMVKPKTFTFSKITGSRVDQSPNGGDVKRFEYEWGSRLTKKAMKGAGIDEHAKRYAGMVKFKRGPGNDGVYMTFRVMHQDSAGWNHPGTQGKHLAERTFNEVQSSVMSLVNRGVEEDLKVLGLTG